MPGATSMPINQLMPVTAEVLPMALPRSSNFMLGSIVLGLPILWYEHPMAVLGTAGLLALSAVALTSFLAGLAFWAIDGR